MTKWARPGGFRPEGWQWTFKERSWKEIAEFLQGVPHPDLAATIAVVRSVGDSDLGDELVGTTSMHDLIVAQSPGAPPPVPVLIVRVQGSTRRPEASPGHVIIEHWSSTGHNDLIERPVAEAVPLFWRFVREKFGLVVPDHDGPKGAE